MDYTELLMHLQKLADVVGQDNIVAVIIKGRLDPILACSIPDGAVPAGWQRVNEMALQSIQGFQRIRLI